jgi:hypothetical protein
MRDAFGGVFMIRLLLVFIVIYVAFTAISLNYAKAFKIKNSIISYLEENQVLDLHKLYADGSGKKLDELNNILINARYNKTCNKGNKEYTIDKDGYKGFCYNGVEIIEKEQNNKAIYYTIYTYNNWNMGILNTILALAGEDPNSEGTVSGTWRISGEAKVIKR